MATREQNGQFTKPPLGTVVEKTGPQRGEGRGNYRESNIPNFMEAALASGLPLFANGTSLEDLANPMLFPGYDSLYTGSYATYRWMLQHPVLRLVRSIDVGIIAANTWEYEKTDPDAPDEWLAHARTTFNRLRSSLIWDFFVRGRDYGWAGGEPIWLSSEGKLKLDRVKPLLQDVTQIMQDPHGNFEGFKNNIPVNNIIPELAAPYKAWKYTYDSEAGYHYGRSWLENCRMTAWRMWLDCAQQLQRLGAKISGSVGIIFSPAGTFPGPPDANSNPTKVSYQENATKVLQALASGAAGAWFPSLSLMPDSRGNLDAMKVLVELAGKSLTHMEKFDFTAQTGAMGPILERMKHAEELMFNAGMRSARVGLEGKHGTKAEAGEHTDTGTINAEAEDEDFARQMQPLVDADLVLNFTPRAAGKIRIKPPSLVDRKTSIYKAALLAMMNDAAVTEELALTPGLMKSLLTVLDITTEGEFNLDNLKKAIEAKLKSKEKPGPVEDPARTPEPQGGRPPQE